MMKTNTILLAVSVVLATAIISNVKKNGTKKNGCGCGCGCGK